MSSIYVRDQIINFVEANAPTENLIDLTARFEEVRDMIEAENLTPEDNWLGLEFIGNDETPVTVPATNDQGKYREVGALFFHVVAPAVLGAGNGLLTRGEALRNLLRGRRIGNVIIQSVTPMNFSSGATLQFEGGYMSGSFIASYESDTDL